MTLQPVLKTRHSSPSTSVNQFDNQPRLKVYTASDFSGYTIQHLKAMYPNSWKEAALYFGIALPEPSVEQIKQTAIKQQLWDFYPTNQPVIQKMLAIAGIQPHHHILEPSAGSGDLANAIAQAGVHKIDCFELHPLLQKALKLQRFNLLGADFLSSSPKQIYDRVIANPPFSRNGVACHTTHAFKFLKPGGKLVTLAHHYNLKPSQTDRRFFDWLKQNNARFLNLGTAFNNSDRPTSTPIQLITINKPC